MPNTRADIHHHLNRIDPSSHIAPKLNLLQLCERFLNEYRRPRIKDLKKYRQNARAILRQRVFSHPIKDLALESLSYPVYEQLRDDLQARGYQNGSVNQTLKLLSTVFRWAQRQGLVIGHNPLEYVERLPDLRAPTYYSRDEVQCLLARQDCPAMVATAIYTGLRKGELFGLTWSCLRIDEGVLEVRRSYRTTPKSGRPRIIPLHRELVPLLRKWRSQCPPSREELVFPVQHGRSHAMGRSDDDAGLTPFLRAAGVSGGKRPWHAFRHSFATLLCEAGSHRDAIAELLGHQAGGSRVTGLYIHLSLSFLRTEIHRLSLSRVAARSGRGR